MSRLRRLDSNKRGTNSVGSQYTCRRSRGLRQGLERLEERRVLAGFVESFGGAGDEHQYETQAMDPAGNFYQSGGFVQTSYSGPNSATSLISNGGSDAFVVKCSADGSLAPGFVPRSFGSSGTEEIFASAYASEAGAGYLYVAGRFEGSVDFGNGVTLTSVGGADVFIAKLDAVTGATAFVKSIGTTTGNEWVYNLAVANNQVSVSGAFDNTLDFDPGTGTEFRTPVNLSYDGYLLQLTSAGAFVSVYQFGGSDSDSVTSIVAEATSASLTSIYIHGRLGVISGIVDIDPSSGIKNAKTTFIAKYSLSTTAPTWSPDWVDSLGDLGSTTRSTTTDANSLCFLGAVNGTNDFDPGPGTVSLTTGSAFIAKYNKSDGALAWAKGYGGDISESAIVVPTSNPLINTLYVNVRTSADFFDYNPGLPGGEVTSTAAQYSVLLKLDANTGAYQDVWKMAGTTSADLLHGHVVGSVGTSVYVAGFFRGTANFPTGVSKTSAGGLDIYLIALDTALPPVSNAPYYKGSIYTAGGTNIEGGFDPSKRVAKAGTVAQTLSHRWVEFSRFFRHPNCSCRISKLQITARRQQPS